MATTEMNCLASGGGGFDGVLNATFEKITQGGANYTTFVTLDVTDRNTAVINLYGSIYNPAYTTDAWSSDYGEVTPNQDTTIDISNTNTLILGLHNLQNSYYADLVINSIVLT